MDNLQKLIVQIRGRLFAVLFVQTISVLAAIWTAYTFLHVEVGLALVAGAALAFFLSIIIGYLMADYVMIPTRALWRAVVHLSPHEHTVAAPNLNDVHVGHDLVENIIAQIYQLATNAEHADAVTQKYAVNARAEFIERNLPLPLLVLSPDLTITFVNEAADKYLGLPHADIVGQNVYSVLDMSFPNNQTLDKWLKTSRQNNATATNDWERVRLSATAERPVKMFDLSAYYNKSNADKNEVMLVLFDHTEQYAQDDQAISFIALSVHELRTPLTLLRGYIEAFEEELGGQLTPEFKDFMFKMNATAQQLTAFVNNILNVARVDGDQLVLELDEENWSHVIKNVADTMALRAKVRGVKVQYSIAPNLPTVGVDRISIQEVLSNLLDNAVKYSGKSDKVLISTYVNNDGLVETSVQDWGLGIPANVMSNLFTKFYRDYHNRSTVGGTGLGLYLCKSIVAAHGGNIWVSSKEGQGSIFTFTLKPYSQLAAEQKNGNSDLVRSAHGWIKNHSLYRR
ncbi:MAG TPA: ATP-binding protein [Candidatus Saccharimonadales bacterium]|nr:ATP-binding protein [Candidatus Saccharimonadales bacterium]